MILGIDPGFSKTGWSVADMASRKILQCGIIVTKPDKGKPKYLDNRHRILNLYNAIDDVCYTWQACNPVLEAKSGSKSAMAATHMAMAQAAIISAIGAGVQLITPIAVRNAMLGGKKGKQATVDCVLANFDCKELVENATRMAVNSVAKSYTEHIYDSILIAMAWAKIHNGEQFDE